MAKGVYRWLVWGNGFMALSAAGWVVAAQRYLGLPADPVLVALAFGLAVAFYTRDRLDRGEQTRDGASFPERTAWVQRNSGALRVWMGCGAASGLVCIALRPLAVFPLLIGVGFALSYTVRWIPWRGRRVAWKQLPLVKMPYVSLLWTILTVFAPAAVYGVWREQDTWRLAGVVCLLITGQILVNDLRDVTGDEREGVYSLPVVVGERRARVIGVGLMGAAFLLALPFRESALSFTSLFTAILIGGYRHAREPWWRPWVELQGFVAGAVSLLPF